MTPARIRPLMFAMFTVLPFLSTRLIAQWPTGKNLPLLVKSGETITLEPGHVYDYQSVTVQSGGTISILPGSDWVIIGSVGDVNIQGTVVGNMGIADTGNFAVAAPDGFPLHYEYRSEAGGVGGIAPGCPIDYPGGPAKGGAPSSNGNGGGGAALGDVVGAAFLRGGDATGSRGGEGATGTCRKGSVCSAPGHGGSLWGNNGTDAGLANGALKNWGNHGGGGGGGARGRNGQLIYIRTLGSFSGKGGVIDVSGTNGGAGGHGGDTGQFQDWVLQQAGGGGGGGTGGQGGVVIVRYGGEDTAPQYKVNGGQGGTGGRGGVDEKSSGHCKPFLFKGGDGQRGQNGHDGFLDVKPFTASSLRIATTLSQK